MKTSRYFPFMAVIALLLVTGCSNDKKPKVIADVEPTMQITTESEKSGYAIGVENGENLRRQFEKMNVDMKAMAQGMVAELTDSPKRYPEEEIGKTVEAMRRIVFDKAKDVTVDSSIAGYAIGVDHGKALRQQLAGSGAELKAVAQGFFDELNDRPKKISSDEILAILKDRRQQMIDQMLAESMKKKTGDAGAGPEAAKNLEESKKFLAENGKKEGVVTTASGLQYMVLKEGTGPQPKATDSVTVHYRGTLPNGQMFDSSYQRNEPITFPLTDVIKGWTEGLQLMKVGSKYKFFIPPDLGYGEAGSPGGIGPNNALIFEVELLKIGEAQQQSTTPK